METQNFSEEVRTSNSADNTRLEYSFSLTILDADTLTIRGIQCYPLKCNKGYAGYIRR